MKIYNFIFVFTNKAQKFSNPHIKIRNFINQPRLTNKIIIRNNCMMTHDNLFPKINN